MKRMTRRPTTQLRRMAERNGKLAGCIFIRLSSDWINGVLEYCNVGGKTEKKHDHYSITPKFHYSNCDK
jgi:hypothetical protein